MPDQLLNVADQVTAPRSAVECRVHERKVCDVSTTCQPTSAWGRKDSRWAAVITNISPAGIRLIVRRRFEPGAGLGVELPGSNGEEPYTVLARIVHVHGLPDGSWALGCQFISELSDEEVERLLPRPPQAALSLISEVMLQLELPDRTRIICRIQRLSVPGAWPLAAGTTLSIRTNTNQTGLPLLKLRVITCSEEGGNWTLRCLLLNPSDDILRALLNR